MIFFNCPFSYKSGSILFNFISMIQHHKWSLTEVENMLPWERDIYVDKLATWIKEENQRIKDQERKSNG